MLEQPQIRTATTTIPDYSFRKQPALPGRDTSFQTCYEYCTILEDYPSPPMSRPPSPERQVSEVSATSTYATVAPDQSTSYQDHPSVLRTQSSLPPSGPSFTSYPPVYGPVSYGQPPLSYSRPVVQHSLYQPGTGVVPYTAQRYIPAPILSASSAGFATFPVESTSIARPGRKTKTHVASACVNCKRAHLSCDVQRPCRRCVDSGKQDTCFDVQHKKRGRPRLREDSDAGPSSETQQQQLVLDTQQTPNRPIASARRRRTESFQSHQSRGSESSAYGPITPQSAFVPTYPRLVYYDPSNILPLQEVPTAFLDLDLVILRANRSFHHMLRSSRDLTKTRLGDILAPVDGESFASIRNRLRSERERREPSFLPPIVQSGQDPVMGISDMDVDRATQGFADTTYTWMVLPTAVETFSARVRLAKASTYFVVVTLLRPAILPHQYQSSSSQPASFPETPPLLRSDPYPALRPFVMANPAPPQFGLAPGIPMQPQQYDPGTAPVLQAHAGPLLDQHQQIAPRAATMQGQHFAQQSALLSSYSPAMYTTHSMPGSTPQQPIEASQQQPPMTAISEEGDVEPGQARRSKKPRRMGIDEVLQ